MRKASWWQYSLNKVQIYKWIKHRIKGDFGEVFIPDICDDKNVGIRVAEAAFDPFFEERIFKIVSLLNVGIRATCFDIWLFSTSCIMRNSMLHTVNFGPERKNLFLVCF